jgi:hypothetical protein
VASLLGLAVVGALAYGAWRFCKPGLGCGPSAIDRRLMAECNGRSGPTRLWRDPRRPPKEVSDAPAPDAR